MSEPSKAAKILLDELQDSFGVGYLTAHGQGLLLNLLAKFETEAAQAVRARLDAVLRLGREMREAQRLVYANFDDTFHYFEQVEKRRAIATAAEAAFDAAIAPGEPSGDPSGDNAAGS